MVKFFYSSPRLAVKRPRRDNIGDLETSWIRQGAKSLPSLLANEAAAKFLCLS
jgi:hypothetical protein